MWTVIAFITSNILSFFIGSAVEMKRQQEEKDEVKNDSGKKTS